MTMTEQLQVLLPSEAEMRTAVAARSPSFDQVFLYGVITTGVFCLPSCAARPARPENLRFFFTAEDALAAGLRPCRRCRPLEAAEERVRLVELARYIEANAAETLTLKSLGERMDMSPDRLRKRFKACFGVSPSEYQDNARRRNFKDALAEGERVTDAILNAGYGSTSRVYGESVRSIGMTPSSYRAGAPGETIYYAHRQTALGWLLMAATDRGVCFAQFGDSPDSLVAQLSAEFPRASLVHSTAEDSPELDQWIAGLDRHLSEDGPRPDLPLDLRGTAFQIRIWRYLLSVPEGDLISYSELAHGVDSPRAVRAAASACAANRVAVLIPCHRVLRGDGGLGGYRWGMERKRTLIAAEQRRKADRCVD
jgi:AraC family transcriptional regulator of adaptative response/methylated-DNA-[protein]-cysteine methyltransferase